MHAIDATGRKVSLLNDDGAVATYERAPLQRPLSYQHSSQSLRRPYSTSRSISSSPDTPELSRSDSCDSQMSSNDAMSPITPPIDFSYARTGQYSIGQDYASDTKRLAYLSTSRSSSFADEDDSSATSPSERPGKRYPCRYRDSHGCDKTFTTSGHASRHSKIHTAEKAVQCTFAGCSKKFTRADNMKQHLETHYKDKSRSSTSSQRAHKPALGESRRNSSARSRSTIRESQWDGEQYPLPTPPLTSPNGAGTWDMRGLHLPLLNHPTASPSASPTSPSSGLDALAMAVACQEGAR